MYYPRKPSGSLPAGQVQPQRTLGEIDKSIDANWNHGSDANQTENVGQYSANPWGFFDMYGNVWEWMHLIGTNPLVAKLKLTQAGQSSSSNRVARGGFFCQ